MLAHSKEAPMTITPIIFGAYLKCQMKCWLRATGEHTSSNIYAEWVQTLTESYRVAETKRLLTQTPSGEYANSSCGSQGGGDCTSTENLKAAKWRLALDVHLRVDESQQARSGRRIETNPLSEAG